MSVALPEVQRGLTRQAVLEWVALVECRVALVECRVALVECQVAARCRVVAGCTFVTAESTEER